jgi:DNA-binding XRE family transcriptional regulator
MKKSGKIEELLEELQGVQGELAKALPAAIETSKAIIEQEESRLTRLLAIQKMLPEQETKTVAAKVGRKKASKVRTLAVQLKELRAQANLSQAAAAKKAKVSQPSLCHLETGKITAPTEKTLQKLAKAYGVSVEQLVGPVDPKTAN